MSNLTQTKRGYPKAARWLHIVGYAITGAITALPGGSFLFGRLESLFEPVETLTKFPAIPVLEFISILAALCAVLRFGFPQPQIPRNGRGANGPRRHITRNIWRWPPAWMAVPIGLTLIAMFLFLFGSTDPDVPQFVTLAGMYGCLAAILFTLALIKIVIDAWRGRPQTSQQSISEQSAPGTSLKHLADSDSLAPILAWLKTEQEIRDKHEDMFNARRRATKLWCLLRESRPGGDDNARNTLVIQGSYGAGKTSLIQLIEEESLCQSKPTYIFARVNCYGFESRAAREHILDEAINALSLHVDCLSLRHMPSQYGDAVSKSETWLGYITAFFHSGDAPLKILQRFTPILEAIDAQLVIVVEDTDRECSDFDQKHIESMLHSFRDVGRVSFVLTAGENSKIDFLKVSEVQEILPNLPVDAAMKIAIRLLDHCWRGVDATFVLPEELPRSGLPDESGRRSRIDRPPIKECEGLLAAISLLNTPRKFKAALAEFERDWSVLKGEVDFFDLFSLCVLKKVAPQVFQYCAIHYRDFQQLSEKADTPDEPIDGEWLNSIEKSWKVVWDAHQSQHRGLYPVIGGLIPARLLDHGKTDNQDERLRYMMSRAFNPVWSVNTVQRASSSRGLAYWDRLLSGTVSPDFGSDQIVFSDLAKALDHRDYWTLANRIDEKRSHLEAFEYLHSFCGFGSLHVMGTIDCLVNKRRLDPPTPGLLQEPVFELLLRILGGSAPRESEMLRWIEQLMPILLSYHPWVAIRFEYNVFGLLESGRRIASHNIVLQQFKRWAEHPPPGTFAASLPVSHPLTLRLLVLGNPWIEENAPPVYERANISWLGPVLLAAMGASPNVMALPVMLLLQKKGKEGQFAYNQELMNAVFHSDLSKALLLLSRSTAMPTATPDDICHIHPLAINEAARLCATMTSDG